MAAPFGSQPLSIVNDRLRLSKRRGTFRYCVTHKAPAQPSTTARLYPAMECRSDARLEHSGEGTYRYAVTA